MKPLTGWTTIKKRPGKTRTLFYYILKIILADDLENSF